MEIQRVRKTLKNLQKVCHKIACEKGFYDMLKYKIPEHLIISEKLMHTVDELSEAHEALRNGNRQVHYNNKLRDKDWEKDTFEDELADAIIRIADLAEYMKVDLEWQIKNKMDYNKKRPYKHGKKF